MKYWWDTFGPFDPADFSANRPEPVQVLRFYLEQRGFRTSDQYVKVLERTLHLQKGAIYNLLKGQGFDSLSRCHELIQAFNIPPQLLGITRYHAERHWWKRYGLSFQEGIDGNPKLGEVLVYYRAKIPKGVGFWLQKDLADATGLSETTVNRMEKNHNFRAANSLSRRLLLAHTFNFAVKSSEAFLVFPLLGLDKQAFLPSSEEQQSSHIPVFTSTSIPLEEILVQHRQNQIAFFNEYFTQHGQDAVEEAAVMLSLITQEVLPLAQKDAHYVQVFALQSLYHQFMEDIFREQRRDKLAIYHGSLAIDIAEKAMLQLPEALQQELLAAAFLRRASAYYEQNKLSLAVSDISRAISLTEKGRPSHIKTHALIDGGNILAYAAQDDTDLQKALKMFDIAERELGKSQTSQDSFHTPSNQGILQIRRGMAFLSSRAASNPLEPLEEARKLTPPELIRRNILNDVFTSASLIEQGEYEQATMLAIQALSESQKIKSQVNKNRIADLYRQLQKTLYKDEPLLIRLGVQLQL